MAHSVSTGVRVLRNSRRSCLARQNPRHPGPGGDEACPTSLTSVGKSDPSLLDGLSFPLTVLHAMHRLGYLHAHAAVREDDTFHVVVVGATIKAEQRILRNSAYWEELPRLALGAVDPASGGSGRLRWTKLHLHITGPEATDATAGAVKAVLRGRRRTRWDATGPSRRQTSDAAMAAAAKKHAAQMTPAPVSRWALAPPAAL